MNEKISTTEENKQKKTPWYKSKKWWKNLLENIAGTLFLMLVLILVIAMFDLLGEILSRDKYIKSVEPITIIGIHDNSIPQFSDGNEIHSKEYAYFIDYIDTTGMVYRHEINTWAPWLNDTVYGIKEDDTVNLYRFHSKGVFGLNGSRLVFEKGGNYYE